MSKREDYRNLIDDIRAVRLLSRTMKKPSASAIFGTGWDEDNNEDNNKDQINSLSTEEPEAVYDTYGGEKKRIQKTEQQNCPNCGASLVYKPSVKGLYCEYCRNVVKIDDVEQAQERALDLSLDKQKKWHNETRVFNCSNCGAQNVFDTDTFATKCTFCDSPSITEIQDLEGIRPNAVVPFAFEKEDAKKIYQKWIKNKVFAPKSFRIEQNIEDFKYVYSPSWTFDAKTQSSYSGIVGDYYYVTVGYGKNQRTERRVRYRPVSGTYSGVFDDININSSREIDDKMFRKLLPFMTNEAVAYDRKFLAGYTAEHYRLPLSDGWYKAKQVIDKAINEGIRNSIRADVIQSLNIRTSYSNRTFKYVLLPIFIIKHLYKNKRYVTYINGRTGKAVGKYPISVPKVLGLVFGIFGFLAAVTGLLFLGQYVFGWDIFTSGYNTAIMNITNIAKGVLPK